VAFSHDYGFTVNNSGIMNILDSGNHDSGKLGTDIPDIGTDLMLLM